MKKAMIELEKKLPKEARIVLQVHDSLLLEAPKDKAKPIGQLLKKTLESICPEIGVPLLVDIKIGPNWAAVS